MASLFDLPEDRLATTDASGGRIKLYPSTVTGPYRTARTILSYILIVFFLAIPWIEINGSPLLLLDVVHRHVSVVGIQFRGDDGPILFFILGLFILTIALVTSRWGRVWCGWACPQTVFIDGLYRRIDRWVEGSAHSQRLLDQAPWSVKKMTKKSLKISLYMGVSIIITHSFLAVFVGRNAVWEMVTASPFIHPGAALVIVVSTLFIFLEFGIFREQFCIIACPYGRLQSVLQDNHSTTVMYDTARGEPRKKDKHDLAHTGDCINCYRCVQVCPTGVDIRRGLQLECIQCTACIDACDTVMTKISKPKGLIRYDSISGMSGHHGIRHIRSILYGFILILFVVGLGVALSMRKPLRVEVLRGATPFQIDNQGIVTNHFRLHIYNRMDKSAPIQIQLEPKMTGLTWIIPQLPVVKSGEQSIVDVFIRFPNQLMPDITAKVVTTVDGKLIVSHSQAFTLVAPNNK